ncbi:probable LRR receptor-like serine/threonine-protein kinase At3g47570 [Helianthus annuus]|uniref:probable LRR receptor-like serine/threonine-protein kinase At3g47570 n=1 Tax=Helianthus annuus TaxID=4232 RepID=UPI000B8F3A12|nr:probable LRR receptor-like serine/threonine-protein kinase At3g47570 [Helianthus annuus]
MWSPTPKSHKLESNRQRFSRFFISFHRKPQLSQEMDLKYLDLSYNNFEGEVFVKGVFANTSMISIHGNRKLCGGIPELHLPKCTTSDSKRGSRKLSARVVIAISLSSTIVGLALVSFILFYFCITRNKDEPLDTISTKSFEKISYGRLFKATKGFSAENLIGTGSFASVYKGVLDESGLIVAIKVLNLNLQGGFKSFMAECDALRNIRHRNLVKVITSCSSIDFQGNDFKALVYDFMSNGSLESWLHSIHQMLDLAQRINIIKDVACALEYLHCHCGNVVVHCDLKPSNILLDTDMVAHVGDFGLAKILSLEGVSKANNNSSSVFRGTIGYAPPEYGFGSGVSANGDIYSYGTLLLEMMTGKEPVDLVFEGGLTLHSYARNALADGSVLQILDPGLLNENTDEQSLISLVKIGAQCSLESPHDRMDIETVVHDLISITVKTCNQS